MIFSAIVLIVSAGITSHIFHGFGSRKWKETFVGLVLLIAVCTQLYFLIQASLAIPSYPYEYDHSLTRIDCLQSDKGGKRPDGSTRAFDKNPCFCHPGARCISRDTGLVVSTNGSCPDDGDYICRNPLNVSHPNDEINRYITSSRNCEGGRGRACTKSEPCDPCDRNSLDSWGSGRCRTCSTDFKGDCNFVPGVGPYCREKRGSKKVVPCKKCCTDGEVLMVDGKCY